MKIIGSLLFLLSVTVRGAEDAESVARYLQYHILPRITEKKIDVAESVQVLCTDPNLRFGPHIKPGIHIYASESVIEWPDPESWTHQK